MALAGMAALVLLYVRITMPEMSWSAATKRAPEIHSKMRRTLKTAAAWPWASSKN